MFFLNCAGSITVETQLGEGPNIQTAILEDDDDTSCLQLLTLSKSSIVRLRISLRPYYTQQSQVHFTITGKNQFCTSTVKFLAMDTNAENHPAFRRAQFQICQQLSVTMANEYDTCNYVCTCQESHCTDATLLLVDSRQAEDRGDICELRYE